MYYNLGGRRFLAKKAIRRTAWNIVATRPSYPEDILPVHDAQSNWFAFLIEILRRGGNNTDLENIRAGIKRFFVARHYNGRLRMLYETTDGAVYPYYIFTCIKRM